MNEPVYGQIDVVVYQLGRRDALIEARGYLFHLGSCDKWGPSWEYPRHLHKNLDCTCGLDALTQAAGLPK